MDAIHLATAMTAAADYLIVRTATDHPARLSGAWDFKEGADWVLWGLPLSKLVAARDISARCRTIEQTGRCSLSVQFANLVELATSLLNQLLELEPIDGRLGIGNGH